MITSAGFLYFATTIRIANPKRGMIDASTEFGGGKRVRTPGLVFLIIVAAWCVNIERNP